MVRELVGKDLFVEVYIECPTEVCAVRDPKGLYKKAQEGIIKDFTGISAPYEPPESPSLLIRSDRLQPFEASRQVLKILRDKKIIL